MELSVDQRKAQKAASGDDTQRRLVTLVAELARELHPQWAKLHEVSLSTRLEQDLGIDSLSRTELILRIERAFRARLPVSIVGEAETVRDLLHALEKAGPQSTAAPSIEASPPDLSPVTAAEDVTSLIEALEWHEREHGDRLHVTVLQERRHGT